MIKSCCPFLPCCRVVLQKILLGRIDDDGTYRILLDIFQFNRYYYDDDITTTLR